MRQPKWDKYEAALLIEAYWKIKNDGAHRGAVISALSSTLRNRASFEIDDTFRNENGINMRLGELEYLFSEGKAGLKNTSDLFREMVDMYRNDKTNFEQILSEAKVQPYNKSSVREQFCEWVKETSPKLRPDIVCQLLEIGEEFCKKLKVLTLPLFETTDVDTVKKYVRTVTNNKIFRIRNKKQYPAIVSAANMYYSFVRALPELEKASITQDVIEETAASNTAVQGDNGQTVDSVVPMQVPSGSLESNFSKWLLEVEKMATPTCRSYVSALHSAESFAAENQLGTGSICTFNYDEALATISSLMQDARFKQYNQAQHNRFSAAFQKLRKYFSYIYTDRVFSDEPISKPNNKAETKPTQEEAPAKLTELLDELLRKESDGITKAEISRKFPDYSAYHLNLAIASCHAVLVLKKYYHRDNISDYQEMADIMLEVITRQFSQNGNYTSAQQLYNEVRPRLDDFFFYNNAFDSRQEVYDLAVHLFEQEKYKGNAFVFMNNTHIWKEEPNYPKDYHGLMIKYAREHGNVFSREEAVEYFDQIGSPSPSATFSNVLFTTGSKSFLQYAENQFVLSEALRINEYFLSTVTTQIESLLEGEDYVAMGEIDDYFYTTLPALPSGVFWSALLLEDVLRVYDTDFTTIEAGKDNDKKTVPAAIIRKNSHYRTFSDVVWSEVSKSFTLPKEFTASEFREFLLDKGFIRGSEKMWSVHKTVAGDIRFYWTDNNGRVTIN